MISFIVSTITCKEIKISVAETNKQLKGKRRGVVAKSKLFYLSVNNFNYLYVLKWQNKKMLLFVLLSQI